MSQPHNAGNREPDWTGVVNAARAFLAAYDEEFEQSGSMIGSKFLSLRMAIDILVESQQRHEHVYRCQDCGEIGRAL